jgi:transposase
VMNGLMYVLSTGCQWRAIPKDLSPRGTGIAHMRSFRSRSLTKATLVSLL